MISFFTHNLKRRFLDGFAIGYNIIFPLCMIGLLGLLTRKSFNEEITSFQYYGIVLIPFCIVLGLVTAAYAGKDDAYSNTACRIIIAPISKGVIVISKILSCSIVFFLCSMFVYLIFALLSHIQLTTILPMAFFYFCLCLSVGSIGSLVGLGMKNFLIIKNVISIPFTILAFFGGTFYPFRSSSPLISTIIQWSPFTLLNRSCFLLLYDHNSMPIVYCSVGMLIISVVVTLITYVCFQKEEYIHGTMPSYEK